VVPTIWYICIHFEHFSGFGIMNQEKSGNPGQNSNNSNKKKFMAGKSETLGFLFFVEQASAVKVPIYMKACLHIPTDEEMSYGTTHKKSD
jgi:hypothetical protein